MKKYGLLKAILIVTLLFVLLTWIIPAGNFLSGEFATQGYHPVGIFSILLAPFMFFNFNFAKSHLLMDGSQLFYSYSNILFAFISIGIFYKILNKTGAYGKLVEDVVKKLKGKKDRFLIGTTLFFILFSSFTGLTLLLFLLLPFFLTVMMKLKYSKLTALGSTVLALLFGRIAAVAAHDIIGITNKIFSLTITSELAMKFILLIVLSIVLIVFLIYTKSEEASKDEDPLYDGVIKKESSYVPILLLTGVFFLIMGICMFNWYYVFESYTISDAYDKLMHITIGEYPITENLFGMMEPFGYWTGFTMSALLLVLSLTISFIYSVKFDDIVDSIKTGIKAMARVCIYVVLASAVTIFVLNADHNFLYTIADFLFEKVSVVAVPFVAILSGLYTLFVGDFLMMSSQLSRVLMTYYTGAELELAVVTMQAISGTVSIIAPTSIFLVAGLAYLDIPYKKWFIYVWKLFLTIFIITLLILLIISLI